MPPPPCHITVLYSPGMCGDILIDRIGLRALGSCGPATVMHGWTRFFFPLRNLRNRAQHGRAAVELADMVVAERRRAPGNHLVLMGHSTGTLIVLEALERLSEPVDQAILLASAVHGSYDLTRALRQTRRMVSFHSRLDVLVSLGTLLCGTADGRHAPAAGWTGFFGLGSDDPKLVQHRYEAAWVRWLHFGGHLGPLNPRFMRHVIWPCICEPIAASLAGDPVQSPP